MDVVTLNLGKKGVTKEFLSEVSSVLKKQKKVRVKILKSALQGSGKEEIIERVSKSARAGKVSSRGHTFVLEM